MLTKLAKYNIEKLIIKKQLFILFNLCFCPLNCSTEKNSLGKTTITTREQSTMSSQTKIYRIQKDITLGLEQLEGKKEPWQEKEKTIKFTTQEIVFPDWYS